MKPSPNRLARTLSRLAVVLVLLFLLLIAPWIAILRSDRSILVLYNESGSTIPALRIRVCGQNLLRSSMPDDTSARWVLEKVGEPSEIDLELATDPPVLWSGSFMESSGGHRVVIRIRPDMSVEAHSTRTVWARIRD